MLDAEVVEAPYASDDVADGVGGPDLVEVDVSRFHAVDLRLGQRESLEDGA